MHKHFLNQTTLDLRKEKQNFLNRELTVVESLDLNEKTQYYNSTKEECYNNMYRVSGKN